MVFETTPCNLCGSSQTTLWLQSRERGWGRFNIVRCTKCGLVFVNPRPDQHSILAYYPDTYYVYGEPKPNKFARLKRSLSEMIAQTFKGYRQECNQFRFWGYLLYPFRNSLLRLPPYQKQGARILDIGCATGRDLDLAKQYGWETYGVDISEKAAAIARNKGHSVFVGELQDANYPAGFFDAVMQWDVMEHVHDPLGMLCEINRILRPDGYLLGKALNVSSIQAMVFRDKWWPGMDVPRHLYFYTPATIRLYLEKTGFRVLELAFLSSPRCLSECLDLVWCDLLQRATWQIPPVLKLLDDVIGAPLPFIFDALRLGDVIIFHAVKQKELD